MQPDAEILAVVAAAGDVVVAVDEIADVFDEALSSS